MAKKSSKPTKNPFAEKIGSGMAKTKGAIKPGKAKGMPLKVGMPKEKMPMVGAAGGKTKAQGGTAANTAHGGTFGKIKFKGKKRPLKK